MANKQDMYFFQNLKDSAKCACNAADYLVSCFADYDTDKIRDMLTRMHELEHAGDIKKHEMTEALAKAFVTPVDREDIALISQNIDDVTDGIEEILQKIYMCKIKTMLPCALEFAKKISECCQYMHDMLSEFERFKKPARLHEMIIELSRLEEECDTLYIESFHSLDEHCSDVLDIVSWRGILGKLENCADACEHVGDCVDMVVMKNS